VTIKVDLHEVTFIDSSGLKEFLEARSRAKDKRTSTPLQRGEPSSAASIRAHRNPVSPR